MVKLQNNTGILQKLQQFFLSSIRDSYMSLTWYRGSKLDCFFDKLIIKYRRNISLEPQNYMRKTNDGATVFLSEG